MAEARSRLTGRLPKEPLIALWRNPFAFQWWQPVRTRISPARHEECYGYASSDQPEFPIAEAGFMKTADLFDVRGL